MTVIRDLKDLNKKYPHPIITIGNFDGVHLGHRALFDKIKSEAAKKNGTSMVLTFDPHPLRVLSQGNKLPLITMYDQKIDLIEKQGIEVILCLHFTPELARVEPEDFVRDILVDKIGVKKVVIGYDYRFGHKGRGNRDLLIEMGRKYGFEVETVEPQYSLDHEIISSTRVRELVSEGQVEKTPDLLGRSYRVTGQVIRGLDRGGKLLGFPTANLKLMDELIPKQGVYAVRVTHQGRVYDGVANIGLNPTFGDVGLSVEVHCFDFDQDIYDQIINVDFTARLRDEKKFSGPDELKEQIRQDCQLARDIFSDR